MGISLTGDKADFSGFIFEDPAVFFFFEGEEVCYWQTDALANDQPYGMAVTMQLFYTKGAQMAFDYVNGEPHALRPGDLPRL